MNPEERMEALSFADPQTLEQLADDILATAVPVAVITGPESVTAAVRVPIPGTDDTTTVLGHVALTRCSVELAGTRGDGIRTGYDPAAAAAAAICDAEYERDGAHREQVEQLCRDAVRARAVRARRRADLVSSTRLEQP